MEEGHAPLDPFAGIDQYLGAGGSAPSGGVLHKITEWQHTE